MVEGKRKQLEPTEKKQLSAFPKYCNNLCPNYLRMLVLLHWVKNAHNEQLAYALMSLPLPLSYKPREVHDMPNQYQSIVHANIAISIHCQ